MRLPRFLLLLTFAVALLASAAFPGSALSATQAFFPTADSYVNAAHPRTNYGRRGALRADRLPTLRSYLRFDLRRLPSSATQVRLLVFVTNGSSPWIAIGRVASTWRERTVTWANRPRGLPYGHVVTWGARQGRWLSVDVTSLARRPGVYSFAVSTHGLMGSVALESRDAGTGSISALKPGHHPRLVVTTTPPTNVSPPSISGNALEASTLTAAPGSWTGSTPMTYSYQWQRCNQGVCSDVGGATTADYLVPAADVGSTMLVSVTATNSVGSASATSAETSVIAAVPPSVVITSAPPSSTTGANATLAWTTSGTVTSTECQLDEGVWSPCMSPVSYDSLTVGAHSFAVQVANDAGSSSATASWTVVALTPPSVTITSAPPSTTTSSTATFAWATSGTVESTDCQLDVGEWSACISPATYGSFAVGAHNFAVRVTNSAGSSSAAASWTVAAASVEPPCTLYASPTGSGSAAGTSPTSPTSLAGARSKSVAGSVVCLLAGTYGLSSAFYLSKSGTASSPIVYRSYGGVALLQWTGGSPAAGSSYAVVQLGSGAHHVEFHGLTIDGANRASTGVKCDTGAHHLVVQGSTIRNTGSAGVLAKACDYVTVRRNLISHTGYDPNVGWASAVDLNGDVWSDRTDGFHNFVVGNVISGASDESSAHSEGHGVIVDRGGDGPPVLIANNVVYENGGRCLEAYLSQHVWFVNNTCYKNALDLRNSGTGEICGQGSNSFDLHYINNVASAWTSRPPYRLGDGATGVFSHNVAYGGITSLVPASVLADPLQLRLVDPRFTSPPSVDPTLDQQQRTALSPWNVGSDFVPQTTSPLKDLGIDPRTVAGVTAALRAGMDLYLTTDIQGLPRPAAAGWDIGAYELP